MILYKCYKNLGENLMDKINNSNIYAKSIQSASNTREVDSEVISKGSPILEKTYNAETKGGKATISIANGTEVFPNVWDKTGNYAPSKGHIILSYGEVPADWGIQNEKVLNEMKDKGLSKFPDRAVSNEPGLIYKTYQGINGRNLELYPLKMGESLPVEKKIFKAPYLFVDEGSKVETLESATGKSSRATVGKFQFIQIDVNGNPYVKDIQDLPKRLNPTDDESKVVFEKIKDVISKRKGIMSEIKEGKVSELLGNKNLTDLWTDALKVLKKVK